MIFVVNDAGFFLSHRLPIALEARQRGYDVSVICPPSADVKGLLDQGIRHLPVRMARGWSSPVDEGRAFTQLIRILRRERPDLVHLITSKPIILGGIAARFLGIPAAAAVSGLGHVFISNSAKARLVRVFALLGYRIALTRPGAFAIFQNTTNLQHFTERGIVPCEEPTIISGSGTDLARFDPSPRRGSEEVRFLLPARMLASKGVREFVEAARVLCAEGASAEFWLAGDADPSNPDSVSRAQLESWHEQGFVRWLGYRSDIQSVMSECDVVVLPSYDEGFPKSLVDAAAAGRAVITTDVTGCRDAVVRDETALLIPPRDVPALAAAMRALLADRTLRERLGAAGRRLAERKFGIDTIVGEHLELFERMLKNRRQGE